MWCCCCVLFSVLFYNVKNSVFIFMCNIFAFLCCGFYSVFGCAVFCPALCAVCVLCGAEASEVLRSTLDVQQALLKELREQTRILAQEKETLEKRCLQQSQHIEHLRQELCHSHTERGNSTGASSLAAIHPTLLTEPIQH